MRFCDVSVVNSPEYPCRFFSVMLLPAAAQQDRVGSEVTDS